MPRPSKIATLPADVQQRLDARLIAQGFAGYHALSAWLSEEGYQISHAAVHRHGQALERRIAQIDASTQAARALMAHDPDAEGNLAAASIKLAQSRMFDFLMAAEAGDPREMTAAARALADLGRATVTINRERERVLTKAAEVAVKSAQKAARASGHELPKDALLTIRRDVYGIYDAGA